MRSQRIHSMKIASALAIAALCATAAVAAVMRPPAGAHAAVGPHVGAGSYRTSRGHVTLLGAARPGRWFDSRSSTRAGAPTRVEGQVPNSTPSSRMPTTTLDAPVVSPVAGKPAIAAGGGDPAFNGLSDLDDVTVNNAVMDTPSPSICVGYDPLAPGRPKVLFEMINQVIGEFSPTSAHVTNGLINAISLRAGGPGGFETSLESFFNDPGAATNDPGAEITPHCVYDPDGQFLYFTVNSTKPGANSELSLADLVAFNTLTGAAYEYALDLTDAANPNPNAGCPCIGAWPIIGFDSNAICVTADEYTSPQAGIYGHNYNGSELYCVDKLFVQNGFSLALNSSEFFYDNLAMNVSGLGQVPVFGLQPAITVSGANGTSCEWLANSFPLDATASENASSTWLGAWSWCWAATDQGPPPTLSGWVIAAEHYAQPLRAIQPPGGDPTISAIDDRLDQLENLDGTLYTTLNSAFGSRLSHRLWDGVAWFSIDATTTPPTVAAQGYLSVGSTNPLTPPANLLAPAIWCNGFVATIVYAEVSHSINPSADYAIGRCSGGAASTGPFFPQPIPPGGQGSGPLNLDNFYHPWGLYSTAAQDPETTGPLPFHPIWMVTEFVAPPTDQANGVNWGTFIFD